MHQDRIEIPSIVTVLFALCFSWNLLAQGSAVELRVSAMDPQNALVFGAAVSVKNLSTGAERKGETDNSGGYVFVGLAPGRYAISVEAKGFARFVSGEVPLTIGQSADFHAHLEIRPGEETVTVIGNAELIEIRRTAVAETISQREMEDLPINGRNYINFTLLASQSNRDSSPAFGVAPTSGLNFQGQRARSNQVSVDGANAVDYATNGIRATASQEEVQEFQLIMSNYMPEFGRATGGVINIVTKSGTNAVHGNVFGYLRHKSLQARNPFSVQVDPATGNVAAVKQAYTRAQVGATFSGPLQKDKTFYFLSYETTRRQETGFTDIGTSNFGLVSATTPVVPNVTLLLTPAQRDFVNNSTVLSSPAGAQAAAKLFALAGSGSGVALDGSDPGLVAAARGVSAAPGPRFPIPIDCLPPALPCSSGNLVPLPSSFVPLRSLIGNYPNSEGTSFYSARLDHRWNDRNNSFVRLNVSPSYITGIQLNTQNQSFGQNAGSRTSSQQTRDYALVAQHFVAFGSHVFNETHFQFARRSFRYGYSPLSGGSRVGVNIAGYAFFGREPFSTMDRIAWGAGWSDNLSWIKGNHVFKTGVDFSNPQARSAYDFNFGGLYNFGALTASQLGLPSAVAGIAVPGLVGVQAYGLGLPQVFNQGVGNSSKPSNTYLIAGFVQDSWRIHPRLTMNYGLRYDVTLSPLYDAATDLNRAAEAAFKVVEGMPRDYNNFSPRLGLAWDLQGNGKTLIRAGYGLFYDNPPLGIGYNSTTSDGARSTQLLSAAGTATRTPVATSPTAAMNASSIFQGVLNQGQLPLGYLPGEQRFDPKLTSSLFINQRYISAGLPLPLLPFALPVAANYQFGYAQQANLSLERKLGPDLKLGIAYTFTHSLKLPRPRNVNATNPGLISSNYRNALAAGLSPSSPVTVLAPKADVAATAGSCGVAVTGVAGTAAGILGRLANCPSTLSALEGQPLATAAFFNFFRPSGPNPSFAGLVPGGYATQVAMAQAAGYPSGFPDVPVPWSDVYQQESSGNSIYHGMTLSVSSRFARHFSFLSSYTWSHAIDDATDFVTLLTPQNNRRPDLERSNSTLDQRHRWVTSAIFESPFKWTDRGWHRKLLADFVVAPIIEIASGRPYTVLTGSDFNLDFRSTTDRPSVGTTGVASPFIPGVNFTAPNVCGQAVALGTNSISPPFGCDGNLGRNTFTRGGFASVDLRISRSLRLRERLKLEILGDAFNLFNRFNVADVSPLCNPLDPASCRAGEPTASLDPRQFQLALKLVW
jgi:hypothetical protein